MWRRGIASVLEDQGFSPIDIPALAEWKPGRGGVAVIAWNDDLDGLQAVEVFCQAYPHIPVVAVMPNLDLATFASAIRAGALGAVDDADDPDVVAQSLSTALAGRISVSPYLARAMASRIPASADPYRWIDEQQADWLRALAEGTTVSALAERIGYSEREMFRMLGETYTAIGTGSRTEAIIWAARHGLLE